ncbi:MAG: Obg family GTPase CgtA, partial [Bacilli bacterium]
QELIVAKGGRGGRGNVAFATNSNPAPNISENGEPGQSFEVIVELKLLADCGLVGKPSVGKSTFLSVVSAARPEIASYHFTTIIPNLGVVQAPDHHSFVMADLPGLIEGASQGKGLGIQFLRHIERTRVIVHIIDMAGSEGNDPIEDFETINNELASYNPLLLERPMIVVANKMDLEGFDHNLELFKAKFGQSYDIYPVSTILKEGIDPVLYQVSKLLKENNTVYNTFDNVKIYRFENDDKIDIKIIDGEYVLSGPRIERLFKMTNFLSDDGADRFARQMRFYGIDEQLRRAGAKDKDIVRILDYAFEFVE